MISVTETVHLFKSYTIWPSYYVSQNANVNTIKVTISVYIMKSYLGTLLNFVFSRSNLKKNNSEVFSLKSLKIKFMKWKVHNYWVNFKHEAKTFDSHLSSSKDHGT